MFESLKFVTVGWIYCIFNILISYVVLSCSLLVSYVASQRCRLILPSPVSLIHIFSAVSVGVGIVASCIRSIILIYHVSLLNSLNCMLCPWPIFSTSFLFEFHFMLTIYVVGFFSPGCHPSCDACTGAGPLSCTSCPAHSVLLPSGLCAPKCPPGYYDNGHRICQGK